jgi:hypothetical protein
MTHVLLEIASSDGVDNTVYGPMTLEAAKSMRLDLLSGWEEDDSDDLLVLELDQSGQAGQWCVITYGETAADMPHAYGPVPEPWPTTEGQELLKFN